MDKQVSERILDWVRTNSIAIEYTDGKSGEQAKRCTRAWDQTARVPDGEPGWELGQFHSRMQRKNYVVVARASNLILIDADSDEDWEAFKSYGAPETLTVRSGKGRHAYYRPSEGSSYTYAGIYFEKGQITPKMNCYLVGPESVHPTGLIYTITTDVPIATLPKEIEERMIAASGARNEEIRAAAQVAPEDFRVPHGQRHQWLLSRAGRNRKDGLTADECLDDLWGYYERHCVHEPPASEHHIKQLVRSVYGKYDGPEILESSADLSEGIVTLSEIKPKRIEHLIRPILLRGTFHLFVGNPKVGKGQIVIWLMAQVTSDFHDSPYGEARKVVVIATEDDAAYDLAPRALAAEVNTDLVRIVKRDFLLPDDLDWLRAYVADEGDVGMVVIDPLANHTRGDTNSEHEVRHDLALLNKFAADMDVSVVGVRHFGKSTERGGYASVLGSQAYIATPRMVFGAASEPQAKQIVHVGVIASNRAAHSDKGLVFEIKPRELEFDGGIDEVPYVERSLLESKPIDDLLAEARKNPNSKKAQAEQLLRERLTPQGENAGELMRSIAEEVGASTGTVKSAFYNLQDEGFATSQQAYGRESLIWMKYVDIQAESAVADEDAARADW